MNLKTLCSAVLCAVIFSVVHASPTPDNLEKRAAQLEAMAEMMRATDPDFADWVKDQSSIYKSYKKAYLYDLKHDPYEAPWILDEWNALLSRMEKELEIYRAMPDLAAMGTVDVHDFGAKADGKSDDAPAIQKAIDFAFKNGKGIVFLPKGTYFMKRGPGRTPALQFHKVKNLKLMGEDGTVLLMSSNKVPFFTVTSCENLRFENFHITASNPVFATGIITGYTEDGKGLLVKHDGGLTFDDQTIKECEMSNFRCYDGNLTEDGKTPLLYVRPLHKKSRTPFNFIHGKHVKDDIYSVYPPLRPNEKAADVFSSGLRLVNYARNHMGAFTMSNSDRCRIKKISFDRVGGIVVKVGQCDALFVTDCSVAAAGKEDFSFATCADFFFSRVPSLGGFVSRNIVRNLSDDLFNLHGTMVPILRQEGNTIYVFENYISGLPLSKNIPYIRSIDIVPDYKKPVLINAKTRYRVLSAEKVKIKHPSTYLDVNKTEGSNIVTVQKNISDVTAIKLVLDRDPGKLVCTDPFLNFNEYDKLRKIHPRKEFDLVHFPDLYGQGQVFSNNYFADSMGRAWVQLVWFLINNVIRGPFRTVFMFSPKSQKIKGKTR